MTHKIKKIWAQRPAVLWLPTVWLFALVPLFFCYRSDLNLFFFLLLTLSSLLFLCEAAANIFYNKRMHKASSLASNSLGSIIPLLFLFLSIWTIRFNVAYHYTDLHTFGDNNEYRLNAFEHIANSLVHALQSFSMDEDYTDYILAGKAFIEANFKAGASLLATFYGFYCSILNALAPIAGGAILFDILTNIFPEFRLWRMLTFHPDKESHVFSELNLRSITLAESIHKKYPDHFLVFTDVYVQDTDEKPSEQVLRAKAIGALCLKSDLSILKRLAWGPVNYYLLDDSELDNIESFAALTRMSEEEESTEQKGEIDEHSSFIQIWENKKSFVKIFVFSDSPLVDKMVEQFNKICKQKKLPLIAAKPINESEITSYDLLQKFPLYRTFLTNPAPQERQNLSIMILGDTPTTRKFAESSYWCTQMLNPFVEYDDNNPTHKRIYPSYHLCMPETNEFKKYISASMPTVFDEIRKTSKTGAGEFPYACWNFHKKPLTRNSIHRILNSIAYTDYALIDTGDDLENIRICHILKELLDERFLLTGHATEVFCMVRNPELNNVNRQLTRKYAPQNKINYVGGIDSIMDIDLIRSTDRDTEAIWLHTSYSNSRQEDMSDPRLYQSIYCDLYNYRSSVASTLHYQYKLFSAGILHAEDSPEVLNLFHETRYSMELLKKLTGLDLASIGGETDPGRLAAFVTEGKSSFESSQENTLRQLFWLEKIRWNSFVKSQGFRAPKTAEIYNFFNLGRGSKELCSEKGLKYAPFEPHKGSALFAGQALLTHICLVEVSHANGMPLNELDGTPRLAAAQSAMVKEFFDHKFLTADGEEERELSWEEFILGLKKYLPEYDLDALDLLSVLKAGCMQLAESTATIELSKIDCQGLDGKVSDYKDYDLQQIPVLAIMKLLTHSSKEDAARYLICIDACLNRLSESNCGGYKKQFKAIQGTVDQAYSA